MNVKYELQLGADKILLEMDVSSPVEFFEKISFYANLPKTTPTGETDLKITHRRTKGGYNYYSLVSEQAGKELRFGQPKTAPTDLYAKEWTDIYKGEDADEEVAQTQKVAAPVAAKAPLVNSKITAGVGSVGTAGIVTPKAAVQAAPAIDTSNSVIKKQANDVLARFNLKPGVVGKN